MTNGSISRAFSYQKRIKRLTDEKLCIKCKKKNDTKFQLCYECGEKRRKSRRKTPAQKVV